MPVAYIPRTRELYNAYTPYRWVMNEEPPPWTPLKKPLAECKVALMSSGGVLYRDQPRFIARTRATGSSRRTRGATN